MPDLCGLFKFQKRGSYTFEKMQNLEVQIFFPVENCIDPTTLHVQESKDNNWCTNSGCSKNMTYELRDLVDYKKFKYPIDVQLADNTVVKAEGFGKLNLLCVRGEWWRRTDCT